MKFITYTEEETINLGYKIGCHLQSGAVICIDGDLGTGKTHLTKGLAKGLDIDEYITSPTFTLVNEYDGRLKLYHFDVYRIDDPYEIEAIGFDEYIYSDGVSIIEWSSIIEDLLPNDRLSIKISKNLELGLDYREITIDIIGDKLEYLKEVL